MSDRMTISDAAAYLENRGWPEHAARAVANSIDAGKWSEERLGRFHDFCSSNERNRAYATSTLAFVDWELRNNYEAIGRDLDAATTYEDAQEALAPYAVATQRTAGA
jgi:hypothetical protein